MELIEDIIWEGELLASVIRKEADFKKTTFFGSEEQNLQVGNIVYPAGGKIIPHVHRPIERYITGTSEVIIVKKGRCQVEIYSNDKRPVATRELRTGDVLIVVDGGHGFTILEDTVLLEIKQGPYKGPEEKESF